MFEPIDRTFSPMSLVLQTLLGSYGPLIMLVLLEQMTNREGQQEAWGNLVYGALLIPASLLFAFLVSRVASDAGLEGQWAWIAPLGLEAAVALLAALYG